MFTTEGASFAPVITVDPGAEVLWTWADGTASSGIAPSKNYSGAARRENRLKVTPWSALRGINIGYDAGDGGSNEIAHVPDQSVSAVSGLSLAAPSLRLWCSSYNLIQELDFSGFAELETIECFLSASLERVTLANLPKLKRACFEDCSLEALDLSQCPALEDLRGAVNEYEDIQFGSIGGNVWHICVRDNEHFTDAAMFADLTQFPEIAELYIWNDHQSGSIRIPSTSSIRSVELLAAGNLYSSADLSLSLRNASSTGIVDFSFNRLETIDIEGCLQITRLNLQGNLLSSAACDAILAELDRLGRDRAGSGTGPALVVDLSGNAAPGPAGLASASSLAGKGWTIVTSEGTVSPPPAADTGPARIDFSTSGGSTSMRGDFSVGSSAVWHWSDGSASPAVSGEEAARSGLGEGSHAHYLEISNGAALTRFGSAESGSGRLTAINGLDGAPHLAVLWVFGEGGLSSVGRHSASRIREFHLMGTSLDAADMDQVFADAAASGILNGIVYCPSAGTSASDSDRALLVQRGWSLQY